MINLELEEADEILNQFSYAINNLCFKVRKTAEEYKDVQLMQDLDLCWIRVLANPDYRFDLRNESSALVGKRLVEEIPFVKEKLERSTNPKMERVALKMARFHRTLQQSFSKLIFYHFLLTCSKKEAKILTDLMGEDFYMLPLI